MHLTYPQGEESRSLFLETFILGTSRPENTNLISSSLTTQFVNLKTAYDTARETKTRHLALRIALIEERKEKT